MHCGHLFVSKVFHVILHAALKRIDANPMPMRLSEAPPQATEIEPREHQQERKFLLSGEERVRFWTAVAPLLRRQHEDPLRPCNYVRTTYFDTPDHSYYCSGGQAIAQRLRVREYASSVSHEGTPTLSGPCFLEFKESSGGLRRKQRLKIAAKDVTTHLARIHASPLLPCVTTWYQRTALADEADRIRITIDQGIAFCKPVPLGIVGVDARPPEILAVDPAIVLEVKLWETAPSWLARALRGLNEAHGFSKFKAGMQALLPRAENGPTAMRDIRAAGFRAG